MTLNSLRSPLGTQSNPLLSSFWGLGFQAGAPTACWFGLFRRVTAVIVSFKLWFEPLKRMGEATSLSSYWIQNVSCKDALWPLRIRLVALSYDDSSALWGSRSWPFLTGSRKEDKLLSRTWHCQDVNLLLWCMVRAVCHVGEAFQLVVITRWIRCHQE